MNSCRYDDVHRGSGCNVLYVFNVASKVYRSDIYDRLYSSGVSLLESTRGSLNLFLAIEYWESVRPVLTDVR